MQLSAVAIKRLQKELKSPLPVGLGLAPVGDSLSTLHANIEIQDGAYAGIIFHCLVEVPNEYPQKAPSLYFRSDISYTNGAQMTVEGKGQSVCLDLLGNFSHVHTEWGSNASGWSPSNTIETVLLQLQASLNDMLSLNPSTVESTRKSAASLKCSCGHEATKPNPPLSKVQPSNNNDKGKEEASSVDWEGKCRELESELALLRVKAQAYDELVAVIARSQQALGAPSLPSVAGKTTSASAGPAAASAAAAAVAVRKEFDLSHISCFVTGSNAAEDDNEIFGFGVAYAPNNASCWTSGEVISKTAFDSGARKTSKNEAFVHFLPIFASEKHWKRSRDLFLQSATQIYNGLQRRGDNNNNNNNGNAKPGKGVEALLVLCSLMNSAVVSIAEREDGVAHDNFINAYFALLRMLRLVKASFADVHKHADRVIKAFLAGENDKTAVPNLGEFLVLLHASEAYSWKDVNAAFVDEVDARNVRWFKSGQLQSTAAFPQRLAATFKEAEVSRKLVCFQSRFLSASKDIDLARFPDLKVPEDLLKSLKDIHNAIKGHRHWGDYMTWNDLPDVAVAAREQQLVNAVRVSQERGYHGGGGGGGKNRGGGGGGGGGRRR